VVEKRMPSCWKRVEKRLIRRSIGHEKLKVIKLEALLGIRGGCVENSILKSQTKTLIIAD